MSKMIIIVAGPKRVVEDGLCSRSEGATACSDGCSAAQPVEKRRPMLAPAGRRNASCRALTPNFCSTSSSAKGRQNWITPEVAERLYPYLGGIIRAEKGVLYDFTM